MRSALATVAILVATVGCVPMAASPGYIGPDHIRTAETKSRLQYRGFSVSPPVGRDWWVTVSEQNSAHAIFRRELSSSTHTFFAGVNLVQLDAKLPFEVAARQDHVADVSRFQMQEYQQQPDGSRPGKCLRYSSRTVDTKAPNSAGVSLQLLMRGFVCAHPSMENTAVTAYYSERGLPSELDPSLWNDLDNYLRGVQLESAPGVPAS